MIVPAIFIQAKDFHSGYAIAREGIYCERESLAAFEKKEEIYIGKDGFIMKGLERETFDSAYHFRYGYASVKKDGENALIDTTGKIIFDYGELGGYSRAIYPNIIKISTDDHEIGYIRPWGEVIWETQK